MTLKGLLKGCQQFPTRADCSEASRSEASKSTCSKTDTAVKESNGIFSLELILGNPLEYMRDHESAGFLGTYEETTPHRPRLIHQDTTQHLRDREGRSATLHNPDNPYLVSQHFS